MWLDAVQTRMKIVTDGPHLENAQRTLNIWLELRIFLAIAEGVVRCARILTFPLGAPNIEYIVGTLELPS